MNIFLSTMTIDQGQEHWNSYQTDNQENEDAAGDAKRRLKTELLADEICRLLFGDSTNLLEDILTHPLSIDYFNIYLSLPIFGQRVLYQRIVHQFDFDPSLLSKDQSNEEAKEWLIRCRLNNYIRTDIYIENLLGLLLTKADDRTDAITEEQSYIFSTVTDVRQFYQFLQSTSGIKYWNFFIDSLRLLRSRRSRQFNRIDISYLKFIYKYYSQKNELHSITVDLDDLSMPNSSTSDTVWFQMTINAMYQLRNYWLPRYLNQVSSPLRSKIKQQTIDSNQNRMENAIKSSSENTIATSLTDLPRTESTISDARFIKHTLGNISYLDYNPQQYVPIQSSEEHDFNESENTNEIENDRQIEVEEIFSSFSDRSIEDYASDANLELFYRILVSDSLAGSPFLEYISQTIPKTDAISYQTCLRFIADVEILLSIPYGRLKERILREFISQYLHITATEQLPKQIHDIIGEQRIDLIQELQTNDDNQYFLLWKLLLEITKLLIPHFLNYIKFDRLRFLIQAQTVNFNLIFEDFRRLFPSINFETFRINQQNKKELNLERAYSNESEFDSRSRLSNCGEQQNDLLDSLIKNQYHTTEKLINTDEQCEFRPGERFPPLTDIELEEEVRRFRTRIQWKDIKTILGKSFNISIPSHPPDHTTSLGGPLSSIKVKESSISKEDFPLNSVETFTLDIMNSAREIVEIDCFVTNLMDESLDLFHTKSSFDSTKSALNSSPLSPVFEEILLTDSSPSTTSTSPQLIINNINNNAIDDTKTSLFEKGNQITSTGMKFLSVIGSYFINLPSLAKANASSSSPSKSTLLSEFESELMKNSIDNKYMNNKTSSTINLNHANLFHESIKFAQKDASNEVKNLLVHKQIFSSSNDDHQQLLDFIQNQITNDQWPLEEYIGRKGQRAWRALKLAADISNLDNGLLLNYHNDFDWISTDENFGSFGERNCLILRNFSRRLEQQNQRKSLE